MRFLRTSVLTVLLVGTGVVRPLFAQDLATEYPAPCDASRMSKADVDRAHTVFLSGKQFLEESNYDKAISYFKDAYAIDCSIHAILPIIATAYERKGDKPAAIRALQEYLKRAPSAPDHDVIERRIKNLTDQLGHESAPAVLPPAANPTAAPAVTAAATMAGPATPPPSSAALFVSPPVTPPAPATPPGRTAGAAPWVLVGIGGAAVVASVVFYGVGISDVSNAANECPQRVGCDPDVAKKGNDGRSLETLGGVVGGVGLAAVGAGILWYVLSQKPEHGVTATLSLVPTLVPGYAGLGATGSF